MKTFARLSVRESQGWAEKYNPDSPSYSGKDIPAIFKKHNEVLRLADPDGDLFVAPIPKPGEKGRPQQGGPSFSTDPAKEYLGVYRKCDVPGHYTFLRVIGYPEEAGSPYLGWHNPKEPIPLHIVAYLFSTLQHNKIVEHPQAWLDFAGSLEDEYSKNYKKRLSDESNAVKAEMLERLKELDTKPEYFSFLKEKGSAPPAAPIKPDTPDGSQGAD